MNILIINFILLLLDIFIFFKYLLDSTNSVNYFVANLWVIKEIYQKQSPNKN